MKKIYENPLFEVTKFSFEDRVNSSEVVPEETIPVEGSEFPEEDE